MIRFDDGGHCNALTRAENGSKAKPTATNMPFTVGNKLAPGGVRPGSGRISDAERLITGRVTKRLLRKLERASDKIFKTYVKLAKGYEAKRFTESGKEYKEFIVDAPTTRHVVDKFLASAKQEIELSGTFKVVKVDSFDPDAVDDAILVNPKAIEHKT